jgi:hypothetical protein
MLTLIFTEIFSNWQLVFTRWMRRGSSRSLAFFVSE